MSYNFADSSSVGRRLPVYLLLDISGSMDGAPLQAVNQGVSFLYNELMDSPQAVETCWISVITFESQAQQVVPLTELIKFTPPVLQSGGSTSMGAALDILSQAIDHEIIGNAGEKRGDYKPLIFLLTDGEPTDDWRSALQRLHSRTQKKPATIIAIGCGQGANMSTLKQITEHALRLSDATPDAIASFFKWVSQSIQSASIKASGGGGQTAMPAPPPTMTIEI